MIPLLAPLLVLSEESVPVFHWSHIAGDVAYIVANNEENAFDWKNLASTVLWAIYVLGVVVVILKMLYGLTKIYSYHKHGQKEDFNGYRIVTTEAVHLPFSFFKGIYVSRHVPLQDHIHTILEHEEIHIRQYHTLDVLMAEMVHAFFWFNPVMIFYNRALRQAHEYLADDLICRNNSVSSYTELLLSKSQSGLELALTNQFFHSQIKKRIQMMTTHKTNRWAAWKYALVLPLLMGLVVLFSSSAVKEQKHDAVSSSNDSIPLPPPPPKMEFTKGVKSIHMENKKAIVKLTNGKTEKYDLNNLKEKEAFHSKYGGLPDPPPPPSPPSPSELASPPPPPLPSKKKLMANNDVDEMPRFPGCEHIANLKERNDCAQNKLLEYIYTNIKYPADARENGIQGNVAAKFTIDVNGYIYDLKLLKDIGGGCGEDVLKVITSMNRMPERWIPGKHNGKSTNVEYVLPIKFALEDGGGVIKIDK